jgi:nitrate reductase beta subunit
VGLSVEQVEEMYRYLAIANYEDRFVIPTSHREMARDAFPEKTAAALPSATVATAPTPNSTCSTAAALMPSTSPKCAIKRRVNNANPEGYRPADGVPRRAAMGV